MADVPGPNYIIGDGEGERLVGGAVGDTIYARGGSDTVYGLADADVLYGESGNDRIFGGAGNDALVGDAGHDSLRGDAGADTLYGGDGNDSLWGGDGNDVLSDDVGNDLLDGGIGGQDLLYVGSEDGHLRRINLMNTGAQDTGLGRDIIRNFEIVIATDGFPVWFRGGAGHELLVGGRGDDTLISAGQSDTLRGGEGADLLIGAANEGHRPVFDGGAGQDRAELSNGNDVSSYATFRDVEYIDGAGGDDVLISSQRYTGLLGGTGQDSLRPGAGGELDGEAGFDTLDLRFARPGVQVDLDVFGPQQIGGWRFWLNSIEAVRATVGADKVWGTAEANRLVGLTGNDMLNGRGGNDTLQGDAGDDRLYGAIGDDQLWGGAGNDQLWGGDGDDRLLGGAGDDRIDGGAGRDRMQGNAGADSFLFRSKGGADVIVDFDSAEDRVVFLGQQAVYDQVVATAQVIGGDTVLRFSPEAQVVLKGIDDISDLDQWFVLNA